jgi:hypothetical protein
MMTTVLSESQSDVHIFYLAELNYLCSEKYVLKVITDTYHITGVVEI